jgi:hypothetical protein
MDRPEEFKPYAELSIENCGKEIEKMKKSI